MPSSACDWSSDVCSSDRSEEHTSELQSRSDLVCRLLLEKKKNTYVLQSRSDIPRRPTLRINNHALQRALGPADPPHHSNTRHRVPSCSPSRRTSPRSQWL